MRKLICVVSLVVALLCNSGIALARSYHVVKQGQTLASIAKRYRVTVRNLAAANKLLVDSAVKPGNKLIVPARYEVYVYRGDTIGKLALQYKVTQKQLMKANRLKSATALRAGQRLVIPGRGSSADDNGDPGRDWDGFTTIQRLGENETLRIRLMEDEDNVSETAKNKLAPLFRDRHTGETPRTVDPQLVMFLARISEFYEGKKIVVLNAYRSPKKNKAPDHHGQGKAVDIRVDNVPNADLRDLCREFDGAGVGYYPNGSFVHLDVREEPAYWVDWSTPNVELQPVAGKATPDADAATQRANDAAIEAANPDAPEDNAGIIAD